MVRKGPHMIDRSEVSRSLAKAIAFKQCGKQEAAEQWARRLVEQLECADILRATAPPPVDYSLNRGRDLAALTRAARWTGPEAEKLQARLGLSHPAIDQEIG